MKAATSKASLISEDLSNLRAFQSSNSLSSLFFLANSLSVWKLPLDNSANLLVNAHRIRSL